MTPVTVIAGPTASGKSARALTLAEERPSLIINADSMQLYRDLPILSAQPSQDDQARVPHALCGILNPEQMMNASEWAERAADLITQTIQTSDRSILIVGGTGFYLKALIDGLSPMPSIDPCVRADLRARDDPTHALHDDLIRLDPLMAARLRRTDRQRILRALEVFISSGRSLLEWQTAPTIRLLPDICFRVETIMPTPSALLSNIKARLHGMIESGVIREVTDFCARTPNPDGLPIARILGFRQLVALNAGRISLDAAIKDITTETRHYAKRQMTWLRTQLVPSAHCIIETSSAAK